MKPIYYFLLLGLVTSQLLGQAHIVKQRARELSEQNNARQGITPAPSGVPARPAAPNVAQPGIAPQPTVASPEVLRQYDVSTLKTAIAGMTPEAAVDAGQTDQLTKILTTANRGPVKASAKLLGQLSRDMGVALGQAKLTAANQAQMAEDVVSLLEAETIPAAQVQERITSVQATLQRGGVERKAAVAVANDLKSVAAEIQKANAK